MAVSGVPGTVTSGVVEDSLIPEQRDEAVLNDSGPENSEWNPEPFSRIADLKKTPSDIPEGLQKRAEEVRNPAVPETSEDIEAIRSKLVKAVENADPVQSSRAYIAIYREIERLDPSNADTELGILKNLIVTRLCHWTAQAAEEKNAAVIVETLPFLLSHRGERGDYELKIQAVLKNEAVQSLMLVSLESWIARASTGDKDAKVAIRYCVTQKPNTIIACMETFASATQQANDPIVLLGLYEVVAGVSETTGLHPSIAVRVAPYLRSESRAVQASAIAVMGELGSAALPYAPQLASALTESDLRSAARDALLVILKSESRLNRRDIQDLNHPLAVALRAKDEDTRRAALEVMAINRYANPKSLHALAGSASSADVTQSERLAAVDALAKWARIYPRVDVDSERAGIVTQALIQVAMSDPDAVLRDSAMKKLESMVSGLHRSHLAEQWVVAWMQALPALYHSQYVRRAIVLTETVMPYTLPRDKIELAQIEQTVSALCQLAEGGNDTARTALSTLAAQWSINRGNTIDLAEQLAKSPEQISLGLLFVPDLPQRIVDAIGSEWDRDLTHLATALATLAERNPRVFGPSRVEAEQILLNRLATLTVDMAGARNTLPDLLKALIVLSGNQGIVLDKSDNLRQHAYRSAIDIFYDARFLNSYSYYGSRAVAGDVKCDAAIVAGQLADSETKRAEINELYDYLAAQRSDLFGAHLSINVAIRSLAKLKK